MENKMKALFACLSIVLTLSAAFNQPASSAFGYNVISANERSFDTSTMNVESLNTLSVDYRSEAPQMYDNDNDPRLLNAVG